MSIFENKIVTSAEYNYSDGKVVSANVKLVDRNDGKITLVSIADDTELAELGSVMKTQMDEYRENNAH
jgi:hypothetical protein